MFLLILAALSELVQVFHLLTSAIWGLGRLPFVNKYIAPVKVDSVLMMLVGERYESRPIFILKTYMELIVQIRPSRLFDISSHSHSSEDPILLKNLVTRNFGVN